MKAKFQPVLVEWDDARSSGRWMTMSEFSEWSQDFKSRNILSCGLLAVCDTKLVTLVKSNDLHKGELRMVAHALEIPRPMVKRIRELELKSRSPARRKRKKKA